MVRTKGEEGGDWEIREEDVNKSDKYDLLSYDRRYVISSIEGT